MSALRSFVEVEYLRQLREEGLTLKEASEVLEVSEPTTSRIARRLRSDVLDPLKEYDLSKQLVFALSQGELSAARLYTLFPKVDNDKLCATLDDLVEKGKLTRRHAKAKTLYSRTSLIDDLLSDSWTAKIGSLHSLVDNLADCVAGRLVDEPVNPNAAVRTVTLQVQESKIAELQDIYKKLLTQLIELEERSLASSQPVKPIRLSLFWAPAPSNKET